MILDNENQNLKIHEWFARYIHEGKLNVVTGYFTVGALAYLSRVVNGNIKEFKFILGDIVHTDNIEDRTLDLLNDNITLESALLLNQAARTAVEFLKQDKVHVKTLEPNFCHAKAYIFESASKELPAHFYISGSSNLTEAGIGLKPTHNIELNSLAQGTSSDYNEIRDWFKRLWERKEAYFDKTIQSTNGKKTKINFKEYLINEIEKIFKQYTPLELYYKVLFELFGDQILISEEDPWLNRQIGRLENTVIYNSLYEFQRNGVLSLIKMLQKYDGAILADAVGLGKTWSALAIMKFFELEGYEIILICPKKLEQNWRKFLRKQNSKFEDDKLDYTIRFHTDLQDDRLEKHQDALTIRDYFQSDKPKLIVIDESHNFRNDKSMRYNFLVDQILKKNEIVKVLMLSATPINNTLLDIRNQFKLMVKNNSDGFYETLRIRNIDYTFRYAQKVFNEWRELESKTIEDFIKKLPSTFFNLTDSLVVARTRKMIADQTDHLTFPAKAKPDNIFVTPKQIGNFESFEELFEHFPPMLCGYQPSFYIEQPEEVEKIFDERQRDRFLVKMMYILMVKRLESSWFSFMSTVQKILEHHQNALRQILEYQKTKRELEIESNGQLSFFEEEEDNIKLEEYTLGKKRKIKLTNIESTGNLDAYKKDLKEDIASLDNLLSNLKRFQQDIEEEKKKKRNQASKDTKLEALIEKIKTKRESGFNNSNQKVVIFTVYKDTAFYLFDQLKARGFTRIAAVSGDESKTYDSEHSHKNFEPILQRFAPYTKLFGEKEWREFTPSENAPTEKAYLEWQNWIEDHHPEVWEQLQNPIDILIATDTLSEGQNLQDCDMVINYDIHWNPVRVIQRMGRIDRLGSPNEIIFGVNFWPSENINKYLNLQSRIEDRITAMRLAGSEVDLRLTQRLAEIARNEQLELKQVARMLEQMQISWEDIEVSEQGLGFGDLSLESFRQDLSAELRKTKDYYDNMPCGVYTGFQREPEICETKGIIALLGYPAKPSGAQKFSYQSYDLIYINMQGEAVLLNQREILEALAKHKDKDRYVPDAVDRGEAATISELAHAMRQWLKNQAAEEMIEENGEKKVRMGESAKDVLNKLKHGDPTAIQQLKTQPQIEEKYQPHQFDLLVWFLVS